jgi:predicted unusual protein kinase regulating ubiquinone biosynthesis (AarF/ABC1/UbiB family)
MPREITSELAGLQDEVGAESFEAIRGEVEAEFGGPLSDKFFEFDHVPIASASIGQVHQARLCAATAEGEPCPPVVVKVQRPRIQQIVEADLAAIRAAGSWLQRFRSVRRHANVPALIDEFSRSLSEELDYLQEGKNAERFARNFTDRPEVVVPRVVWSHTTKRVLTLEDVGAIKITEYAAIEAAGIDRAEVAEKLLDVYLKQVFEDGFFHADPHPGNLFVLPAPTRTRPGGWKLVFVDFGMSGTLSAEAFSGLREVLLAVGTRCSCPVRTWTSSSARARESLTPCGENPPAK